MSRGKTSKILHVGPFFLVFLTKFLSKCPNSTTPSFTEKVLIVRLCFSFISTDITKKQINLISTYTRNKIFLFLYQYLKKKLIVPKYVILARKSAIFTKNFN